MSDFLIPINDGFTYDGKIEARGKRPQVNFRFRPALSIEVSEYLRGARQAANAKEEQDNIVKFIKAHLVSWDIKELEQSIPISPENLRRIPYLETQIFCDYITGFKTIDDDTKS
jgi:hypothetical protein